MTELEQKIEEHLAGFIERQNHLKSRLQRIETMENSISETIQKTVNGKIDAIQATLKAQNVVMGDHIEMHKINDASIFDFQERVEPYIKKAEDDKLFYEGAERRGKEIIFWSSFLVALGIIVASVRYIFK